MARSSLPGAPGVPPIPGEAVPRLGPASYAYLQRILRSRTGTVLERGKDYLIETRLFATARTEGFGSVERLLEALQTEPETGDLHRTVVEAMLNGETSFFRDHYPFEVMRRSLLPALLRRRAASRTLHVWCAAVSSGQEAYSVAMLLREQFPETTEWRVRILATDVSEGMLERARAGRYRQVEVNRGLPAPLLVKYFDRIGNEWHIREPVRSMVDFSHLNLAAAWPGLPPVDLLLLRNVLIYFSSDARGTILQNVRRTLRRDGYLFVGGGETSLVLDRTFEAVREGRAVYYRLPDGAPEDPGSAPRETAT
jgi:chemotaxis protein methyltransferase CheR